MKQRVLGALLGCGLSVLLASPIADAWAAKVPERTKQKQQAEQARADLQKKLEALKQDIDKTEAEKSHAADELAESEEAISDANRSLHDLENEQHQIEARLAELERARNELLKAVADQQKQLAVIVRNQYTTGNEDRIKLLLSGDNPNRINRDLQYYGYVSRAEAKLIAGLRSNLAAIESNKADAEESKQELEDIANEQRKERNQLEKQKAQHKTLVAQLSSKLSAQRKEEGNIKRDQERLGALVDKLAKVIAQQEAAERAAAEKRRKDQEAKRLAELEKQKNEQKPKLTHPPGFKPDPIDADEPPKTAAKQETVSPPPELSKVNFVDFSALKGQMHLPVKGNVLAKFGAKRESGVSWNGIYIKVEEGSEVRAIAPGRVIFADWMRGQGNLLIVDHGKEYWSIYGNNQAILKHVNDTVKAGEVIATAGNSGGQEQSGLYFELRYRKKPLDPLEWMSSR